VLITGYLPPAHGKVVESCNIPDGVGGGLVEDRGDETADPEAAGSDTWSCVRANPRTGAKALEPRLAVMTAHPLVPTLRAARAERRRAVPVEWPSAELTPLHGRLTRVDLR
jgi:hypothetical protein